MRGREVRRTWASEDLVFVNPYSTIFSGEFHREGIRIRYRMGRVRSVGIVSIFVFAGAASGQVPPNLAAYLKAHPDEQGLAVSAEERKPLETGAGLARYSRKAVKVGGVAAIVPLNMIAFDETMSKPPNLYDGLPRDAKVLYLMSTFDAQQWRKAAGGGIGLGDLHGEQQNVFLSLLPKRIAWTKERAGVDRLRGNAVARGVVDERERTSTRLRIERQMEFHVPLADNENAYTFRSPDMEAGEPGHETYRRDDEDDRTTTEAFGLAIRSTVPNVPKKGQLDTASLNASVTLPDKTTVGDALAKIGAASGRTILADIRVRDRIVSWPGGAARAGDLLDALAWALEATYRRVDGTYLLVADVVGAGTRKLKVALWKQELEDEVARRQDEWRKGLAATGLAETAKFPANDPMSPNDATMSHLGRSPWDKGFGEYFPTTELSTAQQAFLDRQAERYKTQPVRRDRIAVAAKLKYGFVLPNGTPLATEGYLGEDWEFKPLPKPGPGSEPPAAPMATLPAGAKRPLMVHLDSKEEAARAGELAKKYGFSELWVEADQPEVVTAAIASGIPTRLFARPWALRTAKADSDRTILGETGRAVMARQDSSSVWAPLIRMVRLQSWPRMGPVLADSDVMSPFDPNWPARRNALAALARTPGLAGVVLNETVPHGYELEDDNSTVGSYSRLLQESWAFGYDERARMAFFRAKGVDPVDVETGSLLLDIDMQGAYFPAEGKVSTDGLAEEWREFRAKANLRALAELRNATPGVAYMADIRRVSTTQVPLNGPYFAPWLLVDSPPLYHDQYIIDFPESIRSVVVPDPRRREALDDAGSAYRGFAKDGQVPVALDLTRVPVARWSDLLEHWLKPAG